MMTSEITLVIPTYNALDYALLTIETALQSTSKARVLVVDDASPDWDTSFEAALFELGPRVDFHRFPTNGGLTRSWNFGVAKGIQDGARYIAAGNADLRFPMGWWEPMKAVLEHSGGLVGPLTNAPGCEAHQDIRKWQRGYNEGHQQADVDETQRRLNRWRLRNSIQRRLSGFFVAGSAESFDRSRFSAEFVYDPSNLMIGNEYQLQSLAEERGIRSYVALKSFVYHFRSVSRGLNDREGDRGWSRLS
ncbi:MAG: glycosyltransferase [Planctomycetaceae bacterium]|nr:glycosyltransferase [Planctomycetaceae bacterium]